MKLRNVNFRPVCNASGARGFFGEGYPFHKWWKLIGLIFKDCGFVAKTTTLFPRKGNMPLGEDGITPMEWSPKCIVVKPHIGVVLNSVGLSGPGAETLLHDGRWQRRSGEPFFISFMSVQDNMGARLSELGDFVKLLKQHLPGFGVAIGLEMNFSCPNIGINPSLLINEVGQALDIAAELGIPLRPKFNATVPVKTACMVCNHAACDALTMSNTIPWGKLPEQINWQRLFGSDKSPLAHLGGGGLSGWPLMPIVCNWISTARANGFSKPIWACGGIDSIKAVDQVKSAGASGLQLGTVATLRPWRMRKIIRYANQEFPF